MSFSLDSLRAMVEEKRKELEELEAAIRVMERLETKDLSFAPTDTPTPSNEINDDGIIDLNNLDVAQSAPQRKRSLKDDVRDLVPRFGDQEFTVSHVEAALKNMGKTTNAKNFKNRLSMLVRTLADENVIERTYKGAGKTPHKYRYIKESE